ncbi:glycosyltransferase family 2 protein [bacterium]|nr:glycosyltransferase family 2 protein [candidate division CSSED10-310 bacterium]
MPKLSIVMPAFNEESAIESMVRSCEEYLGTRGHDGEVIVVDDGSTDGTAAILRSLAAELPAVKVVRNSPNRGYGFSLQRALAAATGDLVATIDSDGQFSIDDLDALFPLLREDVQAVTGYRIRKRDSMLKVCGDRVLNRIIRLMFGMRLRDTNCALKLYRRSAIEEILIEANGFPAPTELLVKLQARGCCIEEAPVSHYPRGGGASSLAPVTTGCRMLAFLMYLRMKLALYRRRIIREL